MNTAGRLCGRPAVFFPPIRETISPENLQKALFS
jgi:hypothetical protein